MSKLEDVAYMMADTYRSYSGKPAVGVRDHSTRRRVEAEFKRVVESR